VNHVQAAISGSLAGEAASARELDQIEALEQVSGRAREPEDARRHRRWLLITGAVVVLIWLSYFAGVSALLGLGSPGYIREVFIARAIVTLAGIVISFAIVGMQSGLANPTLARRAMVALVAAITAPAIQAVINVRMFNVYFPGSSPPFGWPALATDYAWRVWTWIATCGMILAMSYAADIRERERRILALQSLAHSAQLRALRFQLNPHFLFNALNSVAGLISARRMEDAETMTEDLADFLRLTLALDPQALITLRQELELQRLYLEIEKKRFPDRLTVRVDVPADLETSLVPSLITQPLIENSIKYAVARSTRPVELAITARRSNDQLEVIVADSGGDALEAGKGGACLGLRNVADRIRAHYGDRGSLSAETGAAGFRNRIVVPLRSSE